VESEAGEAGAPQEKGKGGSGHVRQKSESFHWGPGRIAYRSEGGGGGVGGVRFTANGVRECCETEDKRGGVRNNYLYEVLTMCA